jgi:catechol 2,3-dioxygenase-like lactoylglutathione lyase family enzyme
MRFCTQHYGIYTDSLETSLEFYQDVLGFSILFKALADENGVPLKMAWISNGHGIVIELIEQENYSAALAAGACRNHIALRCADMDLAVAGLKAKGVVMECEPFDAVLEFDRELVSAHDDTFISHSGSDVKLRVAFFRGPFGERFELMQDNLS